MGYQSTKGLPWWDGYLWAPLASPQQEQGTGGTRVAQDSSTEHLPAIAAGLSPGHDMGLRLGPSEWGLWPGTGVPWPTAWQKL